MHPGVVFTFDMWTTAIFLKMDLRARGSEKAPKGDLTLAEVLVQVMW